MRRGNRGAAAVLGLAVLAAATACGSSTDTRAAVSGHAIAHRIDSHPSGWTKERFKAALAQHGGTSRPAKATASNARVGALFDQDVNGNHFCTASVVHSAGKSMLVTAAHCVHAGKGGSYRADMVFVPDYRDGTAPEGQWPVTGVVVDQRWIDSSDPDLDVAFVTLGQVGGKDIEDVLGGNTLGIDQGFGKVVQITGYPSTASAPISCVNKTTQQSTYQMRIACTGYPGGTSGSPWLSGFDRTTRTGTVIGVIGGYQQGGDTEDVSYSVYFDADVQSLYDQAATKSS
ncbi:trypsin-like serine peptidase [Streptacidiphilus sp. PAMC 29251]